MCSCFNKCIFDPPNHAISIQAAPHLATFIQSKQIILGSSLLYTMSHIDETPILDFAFQFKTSKY